MHACRHGGGRFELEGGVKNHTKRRNGEQNAENIGLDIRRNEKGVCGGWV
jgi:hypothetical protein